MFGLSPAQLIILLVVILLVFGTKKLRNAGADLGAAVKGFKKAMQDEDPKDAEFKSIEKNAENVNQAQSQAKDKEQV